MNTKHILQAIGIAGASLAFVFAFVAVPFVSADHEPFPSTNEQNRDKEVPGREGQDAPHVNQLSVGIGEVELEFVNMAPGLAFFEYRIDGEVLTSGTPHPLNDPAFPYIHDDFIYPGVAVNSGNTETMTFEANEKVEVRLALGGERDWDFDWVTFEVLPDAQTKDDCKKGGWEEFGFRNQGQCIRFVNTGMDSR